MFETALTEPRTRTRMISFRLTAEEYHRFCDLCSTCGTRSVSALARAAINSLMKQPAQVPEEALEYRVTELEGRVNVLSLEFRKLRQREGSQLLEETMVNVAQQLSS
jgi:hypothetical protein